MPPLSLACALRPTAPPPAPPADNPSNAFFKRCANCLTYTTKEEFVAQASPHAAALRLPPSPLAEKGAPRLAAI